MSNGTPNRLKLTKDQMFQNAQSLRHPAYNTPAIEGDLPFQPLVSEDKGLLRGMHQGDVRARNQPNSRAILNSIIQIGSTVIGDAVAGVGYLGEIGDINDIVSGKETEWGNWLTRLGESIKEKGEEIAPVYASQEAVTTFAPWDGEWWASNIPSIGSTLALIAPAVGTVSLVSRFGKALGIAQKMSAETGQLLKGLGSAVVSRHIENMMESKEVFDNSYQLALSKGKTEEEARLIAGEAASNSYNTNYINLITDVPQYLQLLGIRMPGIPKAKNKLLRAGQVLGGGFLSEAAEEATQFIIQQEAERGAKLELGEADDSTFGQRFTEYLKEPGLQTAAFFGGLGGTVFAGIGKAFEKMADRANMPPEQARQEALKDVVSDAVEKEDFETPAKTINEMKADPALAENTKAQENLAKAEETLKHAQEVHDNLTNDPYQKEKTKLAAEAKMLEQSLQQNQNTYTAIAANIENKDGLDYQFLKLQKEALKGDSSPEAKAVRGQIDAELNSERFAEAITTRTQHSPYSTQLKTLAAEKVRDMKAQEVLSNEIEKYETPEGQEQLAKEEEKKIQQEQEKIINKAQEATTPEQITSLKQTNPELADRLDEIKQSKAAEQSKEAPGNWKDYTPENIDEFMKARYEGRPFLLEQDMNKAGVSTPEELSNRFVDKLTPKQKTSPEPTTQEDFGLQLAEEIPSTQPVEQATEAPPVEPIAEEPLLDQLESEAAAKNAPEKVKEVQEIEAYYERTPEVDDTVDGYHESDKIENPYLGITNDMALYKVVTSSVGNKYVEFSGLGKEGHSIPLDKAKGLFRINENSKKWNTLYTKEGQVVPANKDNPLGLIGWRQPDIPEDELRTAFQQGGLGPGSLVKFVVDTTAGVSEVFDYNGWKSLRILMQVVTQQGTLNVGMVKAFKDGLDYGTDSQDFQAFRKALYNEWVEAGKPAKFEFSKTGTLSEIYAGRYWNTPVRNNPKDILASDEPFVLGVGVTEGEGGSVQYVDNNPGINIERSLREPRPGGVYQAVRAANGKFAWSRIFTKRLSDETARAKKGMFPTWEKFYGGFQDVSLDQVVLDLLGIAEQGKGDEAAAKFWKDNWPNIRRELQSIVRFNIISDDGKVKRHAPDFRDNLPEIFRKNNFTAQSYYDKYKLGERPIQVNAQLVNKPFGELGSYNSLVADRLETDINGPGSHTHSPKFSVKFPDMGAAKAGQPIASPKSLLEDDPEFRFSIDKGGEYEVWDESDGRAYFAKKYPNIPVRVYEQIYTNMGQKAHGAFHRAAGFLMSKNAKKGTEFHEEFHAAFVLGLPEELQRKVLDDAKKHYGVTDDIQAEEALADAFEEYMQTLDTSLSARIKRAFKRLLELIRFSLTNKLSIDYLFDRIEQGKYSGIKLGPKFETRYKLAEEFPNLAEQRQRLKEMMYLFDGVVQRVMEQKGIDDVKEAYNLILSNMDRVLRGDTWEGIPSILSTLQAQKQLDMSKQQQEKIDRFIAAIQSKSIDSVFRQKLGSRGIYLREATANAEDSELFDIGEEDFVESWQVSQFKISPLENLSGKLKRFLDNVPRYKMAKNSNGRYPVILSDIGIPQTHDGKFLYADLQVRLGTSVSVADMTSKLDSLAEHMPHYDYIRRAVAAKPELATHLFAMAQKVHPEFFDIVNHKGVYSIKYSNTDSLPNSLLSEWYTGFSSHYENKYLNSKGEAIHKKELEKKWQELSNKASSQDVASELHEFFLKLGINIPLDVLQAAYADNNLGGIASKFNAVLAPFVNSNKTEISKENKSTRAFAQEVAKYYPVTYQSAHINVEGNRQYEWVNSSYMGKLVAKLKIPHLRDGIEQMFRKDLFYNELLDNGVLSLDRWSNARWGVVGGIKRSEKGRGTGFTSYSDKDTAITLLSMFKEGWHPVSVNSSSSPVLATVKIAKGYKDELSPDQALDKLFALANAEYARITNQENPGWKNYTPGKYAFFPELNPKSGTPGAPSRAKIAETMEQQLQELRSKLTSLKILEKGKLTFDKSLDADTFLRQFIYNFNLRQAEIIMMMQGDPSFYKNAEDFFKRAREVWSPGNYLDTKAQFVTQDGRVVKFHRDKYNMKVLADVEGKGPQFDEIRDNLTKSLKQTYGDTRTEGEVEGEATLIMKNYEDVNETDAQSYIDLYSYRLRLLGEGRWTQELQDAYDILIPGGNSRTVFQPIKPFYYSLQAYKALVYPMQNKDAEFLLVPQFANGNPQLEEMLLDMGYSKEGDAWSFDEAGRDNGQYTDKISFESAIKVQVKEPFRGETLDTAQPIEMHWESWRRQMETPEHYIDTQTRFATQVMKLITADLADNAEFSDNRTGEDIKREYENLVIQDIIRSSDELMSRFAEMDKDGKLVSIDKEKFVQILREEVNQRQLGEQYLDALDMTYNEVLDEMDTALPLFTPLHSTRVESMISSLFKNNITKQKFANGVQLYNTSSYGLKRKPRIVFKPDRGIDYIECYAPAYSKAFDKYRREDGTLHVEDVPKEMLEGLVYRIPTEDKYSMFNIRIIGFTPDAAGGAIILPPEITKIAGLDFDIDKTYGFFYGEPMDKLSFNRKTPEGRELMKSYNKQLDEIHQQKQGRYNLLQAPRAIRNEIKLVQDEIISLSEDIAVEEDQEIKDIYGVELDKLQSQLFNLQAKLDEAKEDVAEITKNEASLVEEIKVLKEKGKELKAKRRQAIEALDVGYGSYQAKIKSDNAKLKLMKEVLQHPSMTKAFLQPGGFHTIREITKTIRKWKGDTSQSASIINPNVIIDTIRRVNSGAALTGIAANYNASKARWQNYPMTLKKGYFLFEGQTYDNLSAVDVVNVEDQNAAPRKVSKNIAEVLAAAVDNGKEPLAEYWDLNTYTADVAMSMLTTGVPLKSVMWFMSQPSIVKHAQEYFNLGGKEPQSGLAAIESPHNITGKELREGLQKPNEEIQARMLQNFLYYKNLVKPIAELVSATKVPDAGAGPSIAHTVSRQRQYYTKLEDRIEGSSDFLRSNSFHNTFVQKGIDQALNVFTMLGFPSFTVNSGLKKVLDMVSAGVKTSDLTAEETNRVYQHYMEYLASAHPFFNATGARELHEGLHQKATAAKAKSNNLFLNRLEVTGNVINFRAVVSIHKEELNDYREAWAEMLKDQTEIEPGYTMSNLATGLVRYSFLRSGFNPQGFGNFAHLQPIEFYTQTPEGREFNNLIIRQVQAQNNVSDTKPYEAFVEQFVRNNFQRLYYIPEVEEAGVVFKDGKPISLSEPQGQLDPKYKKFQGTLFKAIQGIYAPIPTLGIYEGEIQVMREYQFAEQQPDSEFNEDTPKSTPPSEVSPGGPSEYTNWSGGADGADTYWKKIGKEYGISRTRDFRPEDLDRLTSEQKDEVEWAYQEAWRYLGRRELAEDTYAGKLVRRDYLQAKKADAVFAVSEVVMPGEISSRDNKNRNDHPIVEGGTGYAVTMGIQLGKPVYVFDQVREQWFVWNRQTFIPTSIPQLTRNFAGIGTRKLNEAGKKAIEQVYANTFAARPKTQYENTVPDNHSKVAEVNALEGKMPEPTAVKPNEYVLNGVKLELQTYRNGNLYNIELTKDQEVALQKLADWADANYGKSMVTPFVLKGKAGTGKTTLIRVLNQYLRKKFPYSTSQIITTSHRAGRVASMATYGTQGKYQTNASAFANPFRRPTENILIFDEISMNDDFTYKEAMDHINSREVLPVFVGDIRQIPPVEGNKVTKFFNSPNEFELKQIVRFQNQGPIFLVSDTYAENLKEFEPVKAFPEKLSGAGETITSFSNREKFIDKFLITAQSEPDLSSTRIVTYSNQSIRDYTTTIRSKLFSKKRGVENFDITPFEGEPVTGSAAWSTKQPLSNPVLNSVDYIVQEDGETATWSFRGEFKVIGATVQLKEVSEQPVFPATVMIMDLQKSTDMAKYIAYNMYKMNQLPKKQRWKSEYNSNLQSVEQGGFYSIEPIYAKVEGDNVTLLSNETGANVVVDPNLAFGYALTAHKAQGGTYKNVFVDEVNMSAYAEERKVYDHNGNFFAYEQNQMKYVGFSRASENLFILTKKPTTINTVVTNSGQELKAEDSKEAGPASKPQAEAQETIQDFDTKVSSLWLNYRDALIKKHPGLNFDTFQKIARQKGLEHVEEYIKTCR